MPLIQVFTSAAPPAADATDRLLSQLSAMAAQHFKKPEQWVMTALIPEVAMTFAGTRAPACFVAVKNIGKMRPDQTAKLSAALADALKGALDVPKERIYVEFTDATGYLWGWNGETFG